MDSPGSSGTDSLLLQARRSGVLQLLATPTPPAAMSCWSEPLHQRFVCEESSRKRPLTRRTGPPFFFGHTSATSAVSGATSAAFCIRSPHGAARVPVFIHWSWNRVLNSNTNTGGKSRAPSAPFHGLSGFHRPFPLRYRSHSWQRRGRKKRSKTELTAA